MSGMIARGPSTSDDRNGAPPSYAEAHEKDWIRLVRHYIDPHDYYSLCLVNRHCWTLFAPLLWHNMIHSVRLTGLQSEDELPWLRRFASSQVQSLRDMTRWLAVVLDFRDFAKDPYKISFTNEQSSVADLISMIVTTLGFVACIFLDGRHDIDFMKFLPNPAPSNEPYLKFLSLRSCTTPLPLNFFSNTNLRNLVYLDISRVPGSVVALSQQPTPVLQKLRILKIQNREVTDNNFFWGLSVYRDRLWSLDLAGNKLTDKAILTLLPPQEVIGTRSTVRFHVEGGVTLCRDIGDMWETGRYYRFRESHWSGTFSHPLRYLSEPPSYPSSAERQRQPRRQDGVTPLRQDTPSAVTYVLSTTDFPDLPLGITHLNVSDNSFSAVGIESLIIKAGGVLEYFACDSTPFIASLELRQQYWPPSTKLYGFLGAAHVFRPIISDNLRELRIHHSFVTNILTLEMKDVSPLARLYLAETSILSRSKNAYTGAFVPDMNPRLTSLTLTRVPRRSSGPLVDALIQFLKLLAVQEQAVLFAKRGAVRRAPPVLKGLRHLHIVFEPDPVDDTGGEFDAEELMNTGRDDFSFFNDEKSGSSPITVSAPAMPSDGSLGSEESHRDGMFHISKTGVKTPLWSGYVPPDRDSSFLQDYRRLIFQKIPKSIGPATPCQVAAGALEDAYICHTAWNLAVMPRELQVPQRGELDNMRDVLKEIKQFRQRGKAKYESMSKRGRRMLSSDPDLYWNGKLSVEFAARSTE